MAASNIPTEEVDLGKLFKVIGNGFRNLFKAILNLFKTFFHYLISIIIFIKKNFVLLGIATLLGGVIGYFLDINKPMHYKSQIIIKTNYGSAKRLYNQKTHINTLVANKDSITLANYFNIKSTEASQLLGFEIKPFEKKENLLIDFDYHIERRDTNYVKKFTFKDYSARINDNSLRFQEVIFYALNDTIFKKLSKGLKNGIENDYYKKLKTISVEKLKLKRTRLEKDLSEIDSLRNNYQKVALLAATTNNSGGTNVNLSTENLYRNNNDISLFDYSKIILIELEKLKQEENRSGEIATIVSDFNRGNKYDLIQKRKWFKYGIFGFILMTLFILGKPFNNYLDTYKK
ncbi:MAG: hypothetical protein L3J23_02820 [Flavobacteriaceae bacterium]|nr:hypothetical protein [Flavobacteriaceae bacterium]